jgi:transposase
VARQVLTDALWEKLRVLLPKPKGRPGRDDRRFLEAVFWIVRTGAPWRDLPPEFGSWKTVYNRYNNWSKKGYLESILETLKKRWGPRMAYD